MRICIVLLLLLSPIPVLAVPLTYDFSASFSTGGTILGSFTYESVQSPLALNVRHLSPNVTYQVTAWNFLVVSNWDMLANTVFTDTVAENSLEFCSGNCVFGSDHTISLSFANSDNLRMRIFFELNLNAPPNGPPSGLSDWGTFGQLDYKPISPSYPVMVVWQGTLKQRVPEPLSVWLLLIGLAYLYRHKSLAPSLSKPIACIDSLFLGRL